MTSAPTIELLDGRAIPQLGLGTWPAVNQIELHPELSQPEARAWHAEQGVAIESWRPQNIEVFDFELGGDDMAALAGLDRANRLGGDPDTHVEL